MKKLFFGVAVVAIAVSASAFTNIDEGDFYIQNEGTGNYILIPGNSFDPNDCEAFESICAYRVETEENLPTMVSAEEIEDLETVGTVTPVVDPVSQEPILGIYDLK